MNILNLDCIHDLEPYAQGNGYPEWVNMEQLYNCEDFYQMVTNQKSPIKKWFGTKRGRRS